MKPLWKYILVSLPLMLSGCGDFKGMPSMAMSLPEQFQQKTAVDAPEKLSKDWWKDTSDETLKAIIGQIETQNLSLEQARFRLNAARIDLRQYDYLPSLTATADAQYNHLISGKAAIQNVGVPQAGDKKTTGYYNAKIDASWEVPLYGQFSDADDIKNANIAFAEADIDAVRASVVSEAVRLYSEMRAKQQEITKRESIHLSAKKIADYQAIKRKAGLITDTELGSSRQAVLSAQNELQIAQSELVARKQQLAKLLGRVTPDEAWNSPAEIPVFLLPAFDDTPLDVLRNRPDIRKAESSVLAAAGDFSLAKSEMYPKLTLSGNLSQLGNLTGNALMDKTVQLGGIPSISLPIFDWGKRLSNAKIKDETLSETASAYRETVIGAMNEVEEFWSAYRTAQNSEVALKENASISSKANAHAGLLFKQGITDGIDRENAEINASRSAIAYLQSQVDTITKLTALTKALGGTSAITNEKLND
jgi:NodT family efflux transporter outer membrane factor (OMF) lipoprotein